MKTKEEWWQNSDFLVIVVICVLFVTCAVNDCDINIKLETTQKSGQTP